MKQKSVLFAVLVLQLVAVFPLFADKTDVAKILYQAHQFFQKKKYDDAIFHFKKAVDADPGDATLYYNIGVVYQIKGKAFYGHAKNWYGKALEKDKKLAFALYNIGIIAYSERSFDAARKYLESARILKPQDKTIQEALREVKKSIALQQNLDEKIQKKQEETPALSESKTQTDTLTKTQEPSIAETKTENPPLTKTQKTVTPDVKTENKKESSTAVKNKKAPVETKKKKEKENLKTKSPETKTQPLTKTQKTVKPQVSISETKTKTDDAAKKPDGGQNKNVKTVVCADIKNRAPVSAKETFTSSDKQVVVWFELKNMQGSHVLESRWYGPGGKLYSSGTQNVQITGPRYRTWVSRKLAASLMSGKKGAWQVEIVVDKKPLKRVNFSIQ